MKAPVVLIIFKRPELTARVVERVREARPPVLFIVADGPRANRQGEDEQCARARTVVEAAVDWPCEVVKIYAETNMGCARRVSSGLDAVFERVEQAIILEDDCVPDASFFPFCEELLEKYRDDARVAGISGTNHQYRPVDTPNSYFFSKYCHIWGWATWSRAWKLFDFEMVGWRSGRRGRWLSQNFENRGARRFWKKTWEDVYRGRIDSWAYRWTYACLQNEMSGILPVVSMVDNVGFGEGATHTTDAGMERMCIAPMEFPLSHPANVAPDRDADLHTERRIFHLGPFWLRALRKIFRLAKAAAKELQR